jgi:hypothetical protein
LALELGISLGELEHIEVHAVVGEMLDGESLVAEA